MTILLVKNVRPAIYVLGLVAALNGCATETVAVDVDLALPEVFLYVEELELSIHLPVADELDAVACGRLTREATAGVFSTPPERRTGPVSACTWFNGGAELDDLPEGRRHFVVTAGDAGGVIAFGCESKDVTELSLNEAGNRRLVVTTTTTSHWSEVRTNEPPFPSVEARCAAPAN